MPTTTVSAGTASRDYSTISAALTGEAANTDDVVIECYNDSAFDEFLDGLSSTPASWTIKPADGEGHDGTAGTGVRIVQSSSAGFHLCDSTSPVVFDQIEMDHNGGIPPGGNNTTGTAAGNRVSRLIVHGADGGAVSDPIAIRNWFSHARIFACIVYDTLGRATNWGAIQIDSTSGDIEVEGNTVSHSKLKSYRFGTLTGAFVVKNNVGFGATTADFDGAGSATAATNASGDATAPGAGSITSITAADEFASVVGGSEDYHLVSDSQLIGAGTDLGTTPTGINVDIDGETRSSWDIGADEYSVGNGGGGLSLCKRRLVPVVSG